jgi:hypothetical protein
MFHPPFQLRHKVKTQRYSIPGYPSLYLGSSLYICWEEMGRPPFDKVFSVRLETARPLRVLDFGYAPRIIADIIRPLVTTNAAVPTAPDLRLQAVTFWPLVAACSVRVLYRDEAFKPEYIIPQLLLQYVKEDTHNNNIDGIRYFSTHFGNPAGSLALASNFVLPVKTNGATGLCTTLRPLFRMTEPMSWQVALRMQLPPGNPPTATALVELLKGWPCQYTNTDFGAMEEGSSGMTATNL